MPLLTGSTSNTQVGTGDGERIDRVIGVPGVAPADTRPSGAVSAVFRVEGQRERVALGHAVRERASAGGRGAASGARPSAMSVLTGRRVARDRGEEGLDVRRTRSAPM
jgi:hypothetical protein